LGDILSLTSVDRGLGLRVWVWGCRVGVLGFGLRVLWLTFRSDFLGLTFLTFWFDGCCGVGSGDSGMPGRLPIGHFMDELRMDEVFGFGVSFTHFACIVRLMKVCNMFSECPLNSLRRI
jgi:hypothetical protein